MHLARKEDYGKCVGEAHYDDYMQECVTADIYCPICNRQVEVHALIYTPDVGVAPERFKGAGMGNPTIETPDQATWLYWFVKHYNSYHVDDLRGVQWLNELLTTQWSFTRERLCMDNLKAYIAKFYKHKSELLTQIDRTFKLDKVYK